MGIRAAQRVVAAERSAQRAAKLATVRFETAPDQQIRIAGEIVVVHLLVAGLSYSRRIFVKAFLSERMEFAIRSGVPEEKIQLDPGIGFGKTLEHNLELLRRLRELTELGRPLVIGTSRKSFLGRITGRDVTERVHGTTATCVLALERGATVFRVHDVAAVADALAVADATLRTTWPVTSPTTTRTTRT